MAERAPNGVAASARRPARSLRGLTEAEYAALEAALSETPLGRWFLAEYTRRHPAPETQLMLDAMGRLEAAVLKPQHQAGFASVLGELNEIACLIARARQEMRLIEQRIEAAITVWGREAGTRAPSAQNQVDGPLRRGDGTAEASWPSVADEQPHGGPHEARFERPAPLTLPELQAIKRSALFG